MFARLSKLVTMLLIVSVAALSLVEPLAALSKAPMAIAPHKVSVKKPQPPQPVIATKPEDAKGPLAVWLALEPQKTHWYKFNYHYKNNGKNSEPSKVMVKVAGKAKGCPAFEVWTANALQAGGEKHRPIGAGSPMKGLGRVLLWVGGSSESITYYIAVKNPAKKTCSYQLSITGATISY